MVRSQRPAPPPQAGNGNWTGVLLRDVLLSLGLTPEASYIGWYGEDKDCQEDPAVLISRGFRCTLGSSTRVVVLGQ